MSMAFAVLLQLTVVVAQPAYDLADRMLEDGTVVFTAILKNVSRKTVQACTDHLQSIRVQELTVDGEPVEPREPDEILDYAQSPYTHSALYPGATVDLRVGALLAEKKKGTLWVFKPPGRGQYRVRFAYRCSASGPGVVTSNEVTFRVH